MNTTSIKIENLTPSGTNPRTQFADEPLQELANSLKSTGQLQPIVVRLAKKKPGRQPAEVQYEIIAGERRYRAAILAGMANLDAVVQEITDEEALDIQIIENLQREDIHPMDEATAFEKLLAYRTAASIAEAIGKTESYVSKRIKLISLSKDMKKRFAQGQIKYIHAIQLARLTEDNQKRVWTMVKRQDYHYFDGDNLVISEDRLRKDVERHIFHKISSGLFDAKDDQLVKNFGACGDCPLNTACSPMLFEDVKGDQCTNPKCYKAKESQTLKNKLQKLQEKFPEARTGTSGWNGIQLGGKSHRNYKTGSKSPGKKWTPVIITKDQTYSPEKRGKLVWVNLEDPEAQTNSVNSYAKQQAKEEKERKIRHEFEAMLLGEMLQMDFDQEPVQRIKHDYIVQGISNISLVAELALLQHFDLIPKKNKFNTLEAYEDAGYSDRQKFMKLLEPKLMEKSANWLMNVIEISESTGGYRGSPSEDKTIRLVAIEKGIDWDARNKKYKRTRSLELTKEAKKTTKK